MRTEKYRKEADADATIRRLTVQPGLRGRKVPDTVKRQTESRLLKYAAEHFAGCYTRLDIRFRGPFCYVDVYQEPEPLTPGWPPPDWPETREEYVARQRNTPTHLCRLRYFGPGDRWTFGFYTYSNERYELAMFPSGGFFGKAEEAFEVSANMYLH